MSRQMGLNYEKTNARKSRDTVLYNTFKDKPVQVTAFGQQFNFTAQNMNTKSEAHMELSVLQHHSLSPRFYVLAILLQEKDKIEIKRPKRDNCMNCRI